MLTPRFTAYTQSPNGRQPVAPTNDQNLAWGLAMQATQHAAALRPDLEHAATVYDHQAGRDLAVMPYRPCQSK